MQRDHPLDLFKAKLFVSFLFINFFSNYITAMVKSRFHRTILISHYFPAPAFFPWLVLCPLCSVLIVLNCSELITKEKENTVFSPKSLPFPTGKHSTIFHNSIVRSFSRLNEPSPPRTTSLPWIWIPNCINHTELHTVFFICLSPCLTVSSRSQCLVVIMSVCPASVIVPRAQQVLTKRYWVKIKSDLELCNLGFRKALCRR